MTEVKKFLVQLSNPTVAANLIPFLRMVSRDADTSLSSVAIQAKDGELFVWAAGDDVKVDENDDGVEVHDYLFGLHCDYDDRDVSLRNFHRDNGPVGTRVSRLGLPREYQLVPAELMKVLKSRLGDEWDAAVAEWKSIAEETARRDHRN